MAVYQEKDKGTWRVVFANGAFLRSVLRSKTVAMRS